MTSCERFEAAIRGDSPDRVPVILPYFHLYLDHIAHELTDLSWVHRMYGTPEEKVEIIKLARTYFELDWISIGGIGTALNNVSKKLVEKDGKPFIQDTDTGDLTPVAFEKPPEKPISERCFTDPDEIEYLFPVLEPHEIVATGVLEPARIVAERYGTEVTISSGLSLPGNQNYFYLGIYDMMTALKLEPDLVHFLVGHSKKRIINLLRAMEQVGITCVWLEDCFVAGDLISREDYETFFHGANIEIIGEAKHLGFHTIYYLTGDFISRIPNILAMNPDCIAFEESRKNYNLDPVEIRKRVGDDLCILGNIDVYADIERGDRTAWERAIRYQLKAACPHGKFILSAGSPITHDTPKEKVRDFVRFARSIAQ